MWKVQNKGIFEGRVSLIEGVVVHVLLQLREMFSCQLPEMRFSSFSSVDFHGSLACQ